jgi:Ni/Co efflux regulator RcnB
MKTTLAAIALTALLAGSPAFAANSNMSDTTGMSQTQPQDNTTQKQRHKKHAHKKRHASRHAKRHSKDSNDSTSGMTQQ